MAKFRSIKNSFLAGQISPTALGRTDLPQYSHACEILQNMIPMLSGGAYRRPGSLLQDIDSINNGIPRMIPFVSSKNEAYAVVLHCPFGGSAFVSAYRAISSSSGAASSVSGTLPYIYKQGVVNTTPDDPVFEAQYCQSVDKMYLTHPDYKPQVILRTAKDTFSVAAFDAGLTGVALVNAYPYLNQNTTATTLAASATTGTVTLTASAPLFSSRHAGAIFVIDYGAGNVGAVQIGSVTNSTTATATVLLTLGGTVAKATWWESAWSDYRGWPRATCIFQQRIVMAGTYHQPDTLWFTESQNYSAFSKLASTYVDEGGASHVVNYSDDSGAGNGYSTGPTGSQPFRFTLSQSQLDAIQWLSPDKELLIGTLSQEYLIAQSGGQSSSFDAASAQAVLQSKYGSDWLSPVRIGYELIMPMATQDEVRAYQYNYIDASFFAEPVQIMFDNYPRPEGSTTTPGRRKIRQMDWDVSRSTLWCLDTAGNFYGMTRDRKLGVTMWHTHQFGGYNPAQGKQTLGSGATTTADPGYYLCDGSVLSFAIVPNPASGINDIWLAVKRTVSGTVSIHYERMIGKNTTRDSAFSNVIPGVAVAEPYLVDAAVYDSEAVAGSKVYSIGTWLNGYSLTGNCFSPTYGIFKVTTGPVSGGTATVTSSLPPDYGAGNTILSFGLPFTSIVQPVRIEGGSVIGTAQGAIKRINRVFVRFYKTICAKVGTPPNGEATSGLETIYFQTPQTPLGASPELFTGDKKALMPTTYDRDGYIYLEQDQPMPFTVVSIVAEGEEYD